MLEVASLKLRLQGQLSAYLLHDAQVSKHCFAKPEHGTVDISASPLVQLIEVQHV